MAMFPLMPQGADGVATGMPGGGAGGPMMPMPGAAGPPQSQGDLSSLLAQGGGGAPSSSMGANPMQGAMQQFNMLAQQVADMARMFPGSEGAAKEMMESLDRWRQQILVALTPQPSSQPGAQMMMQ